VQKPLRSLVIGDSRTRRFSYISFKVIYVQTFIAEETGGERGVNPSIHPSDKRCVWASTWPTILLASANGQQKVRVKVDHLFEHQNIVSNAIMQLWPNLINAQFQDSAEVGNTLTQYYPVDKSESLFTWQKSWSFNLWRTVLVSWGGVRLNPLSTSATNRPTVPASDRCWGWNSCWISISRGNRSTRRKPAPVGSRRLTAWGMARPCNLLKQMIWNQAVKVSLFPSHQNISVHYQSATRQCEKPSINEFPSECLPRVLFLSPC
jgi:hypothetical protein